MNPKHVVELKLAYRQSGLTLKQIACRAGLHENTVLSVFAGRGNPRISTLTALCAVLKLDRLTISLDRQ